VLIAGVAPIGGGLAHLATRQGIGLAAPCSIWLPAGGERNRRAGGGGMGQSGTSADVTGPAGPAGVRRGGRAADQRVDVPAAGPPGDTVAGSGG
jgi:hypothetical protein